MTAMATKRARSYTEVKRELAREINHSREDCIPLEAARVLLSYDCTEHELVGLTKSAEKVVYYHHETKKAYACPFSDGGPDGDRGGSIALLESDANLQNWIAKMQYYWDWIHPRFR